MSATGVFAPERFQRGPLPVAACRSLGAGILGHRSVAIISSSIHSRPRDSRLPDGGLENSSAYGVPITLTTARAHMKNGYALVLSGLLAAALIAFAAAIDSLAVLPFANMSAIPTKN